jgi:hypothetical protein
MGANIPLAGLLNNERFFHSRNSAIVHMSAGSRLMEPMVTDEIK